MNQPLIDYTARTLCPTCKLARETIHHFLFECPTHAVARQNLQTTLTAIDQQKTAAMNEINDPDTKWRTLLNPTHWDSNPSSNNHNIFKIIASYTMTIWKTRSQLLTSQQ
jgi:hypothetical protein